MTSLPKVLLALLPVVSGGCVIVVEPDVEPPPVVVPPPVVLPPPIEGGGEGQPGTAQLWLVRVDRSTATLAGEVESLISDTTSALMAQGFSPRRTAVANLETGQLLWASGEGILPPPARLTETLRYYAARAPAPPEDRPCTTTGLAELGARLASARVDYPPELGSTVGEEGGTTSARPFVTPVAALLVAVVEAGERTRAHGDARCALQARLPADYFAGADPVTWALLANEVPLPRARTHFLVLSTPEGLTSSQLQEKCLAVPGFPGPVLDALAPASARFTSEWTEAMGLQATGLADGLELCEALGDGWPDKVNGMARGWRTSVDGVVGP